MPNACSAGHGSELLFAGADGNGFTLDGAGTAHYPPSLPLEPKHIEIRAKLDVDARRFDACVAIKLAVGRTDSEAKLRAITLDAEQFHAIHHVSSSPVGVSSFHYDGHRLNVVFKAPLSQAAQPEETLTIEYTVLEPISGLHFSPRGGGSKYAATDHETERARYWLPCIDYPTVRTTFDFQVTTDESFTILASGRSVDVDPAGLGASEAGGKTERWVLDFPCPSYLYCFAIGDYSKAVFEPLDDGYRAASAAGTDDGSYEVAAFAAQCSDEDFRRIQAMPVEAYGPRALHDEAALSRTFGRTREMLVWLAGLLGRAVPWDKYYQFTFEGGVGGAMENVSLVSWSSVFVNDEQMATERGWLVDCVNIHEMAHTYFGDAVVMKGFAHAWLKEGWASYVESLWVEKEHGLDAAQCYMFMKRLQYLEEAKNRYTRAICTPRYDSAWNMFDAHLYPGGAWRLHMLRRMLGNKDFWTGVRSYLDTHWKGTADTHDFRRALERASSCGVSLDRFFEQWLFSSGYPALSLGVLYDAAMKTCSVSLEQVQQFRLPLSVEGDKGKLLFDLEIEVSVELEDNKWEHRVATLSSDASLGGKIVVQFTNLEKAPLQVVLDRDAKVLFDLSVATNAGTLFGEAMLRRMGLDNPISAWAKLNAASLLAKHCATNSAAKIILEMYHKESNWLVRRLLAEQLGASGTQAAMKGLCELLKQESDSRSLFGIVSALNNYRDPQVAAALQEFILESQTRAAKALALEALGGQRNTQHVSLLIQHAIDDDKNPWWAWVRRGAIAGLGASRSQEALDVLMRLATADAESGAEFQQARCERGGLCLTRVSIMAALGNAASWMPIRTRNEVADVLAGVVRSDSDAYVRRAAAAALSKMGDTDSCMTALNLFVKSGCVYQDKALAERFLRAARESRAGVGGRAHESMTALEKVVEKMEKEIKSLKDKVERFEQGASKQQKE
uniref:Aminopeptidase n=1 Tax=Erythrolobus australicus TaxID=1077150 RepID=A0A7S1TQ81_9RHOD|mmetsp:Transcript_963/g.2701  ORF Transcript_963/g.2701 Transcript_963/m.2701 type:complete len:956 (+) Transcript_963:35-2902(+)|eukprot:CAMPEP_0185835996 /NCGR_PEP_ID=MMETSP1353-20130828/8892_1 /TAXON_ID=1077150 /ORGANISM="Erythrolobus australicus, Strain CCMP3124" /LENGTH=955 /DNA_ID=CAMNT_0028534727 /DNA_START=15 /DNA_END=2882 /DNA_ORIENTATION=-